MIPVHIGIVGIVVVFLQLLLVDLSDLLVDSCKFNELRLRIAIEFLFLRIRLGFQVPGLNVADMLFSARERTVVLWT